jgi:hypothetical protein
VRGGKKELLEKLGNADLCPCGSGRRFRRCCRNSGRFDDTLRQDYYREP